MIFSNTLKYTSLAVFILLITGCDSSPKKQQQSISNAAKAIAAAKAANQRAIIEKYEWRDTRKLIQKAQQFLVKGDEGKAIMFANKARRQAESAVKQKYSELKRLEHMLGVTSK